MATATRLLTAEEFLHTPESRRAELIDGVMVEVSPAGGEHSKRQAKAIRVLGRAEDAGSGTVVGEIGCVVRRNPDRVRAPDAGFIRRERLPSGVLPAAFWEGAPDLVVEVVSPFDRPSEVATKVREWIEAGARQVWVLYGDNRTVHVARSMQDRVTLSEDEILDGGDAVPGFSCRVSELFD